MHTFQRGVRRPIFVVLLIVAAALLIQPAAAQVDNVYLKTNLISDDKVLFPGTVEDPNLINGWGIAASSGSPWWVSSADMSVATLYTGGGVVHSLVVNVSGNPTGIVFYGGAGFLVTNGTTTAPAVFLFAAEDGSISGWNPGVLPLVGRPLDPGVGGPASSRRRQLQGPRCGAHRCRRFPLCRRLPQRQGRHHQQRLGSRQ